MLFFLNLDGTVTRSDTDHVYQGQNKVANVELFTLISPAQAAIQVAFTLPNGLTTAYLPMSYVGAYSVDESNQKQVHRWKLAVPYNVTEVEGQVGVSFNVLLNDGTSGANLETINQTTYTASFLVEYSALPIPPTTATEDELGQLLDLLDKYYAQNISLAAKQPFVVGTVNTNTLGANQQASVAVEQSAAADSNGNYPTNFNFGIPKGTTFIPTVDANGNMSWTNDGGKENPTPRNIKGATGETGATPDVSAVAEVNNTVGTPSVVVEKSGSKENPVFNFKFSNIKGQKGDPGVGNANLSNTPGTSDTDGYTQKTVNGIVQNPNLLINPNFAINQRGQTSYSGAVYGVDRWQGQTSGATVTTLANGIRISGQYTGIWQKIETNLSGKTVTASCKLSAINSGTGGLLRIYYTTDGKKWNFNNPGVQITAVGIATLTETIPDDALYVAVFIGSTGNSDVVFEWAKLEIGSVATEFSPPSIAEELPKCQRYYQRFAQGAGGYGLPIISAGYASSTTSIVFPIALACSMRNTPTVTYSEIYYRVSGKSNNNLVNTINSPVDYAAKGASVAITVAGASGLTLGQSAVLQIRAGGYIEFDAEL